MTNRQEAPPTDFNLRSAGAVQTPRPLAAKTCRSGLQAFLNLHGKRARQRPGASSPPVPPPTPPPNSTRGRAVARGLAEREELIELLLDLIASADDTELATLLLGNVADLCPFEAAYQARIEAVFEDDIHEFFIGPTDFEEFEASQLSMALEKLRHESAPLTLEGLHNRLSFWIGGNTLRPVVPPKRNTLTKNQAKRKRQLPRKRKR